MVAASLLVKPLSNKNTIPILVLLSLLALVIAAMAHNHLPPSTHLLLLVAPHYITPPTVVVGKKRYGTVPVAAVVPSLANQAGRLIADAADVPSPMFQP